MFATRTLYIKNNAKLNVWDSFGGIKQMAENFEFINITQKL